MDNLTVKTVEFMGSELLATKDNDGIIWAGVKWLCDGIGLSEGQAKSERKKIQEDLVLSKGGRNFVLNKCSGEREVLCLQLDYVPLWLAKISITPNMKKNNPELAEKLVKYQLRAKDVLAAAFLPKEFQVLSVKSLAYMDMEEENERLKKELKELKKQLRKLKGK